MVQQGEASKQIWFTDSAIARPDPPPGFEYCSPLTQMNQAPLSGPGFHDGALG